MQTIKKKLHSNSGASMIMALLLMLVGVVTSAVIIAASLSAALHIKEDRAQQQAYLTVSSAAELIRDQLEAGKSDYTKTVTTVKVKKGKYSKETELDPETSEESGDGIFSSIIMSAIKNLTADPTRIYNETYTISADSNEENTAYDIVNAEVFIKKTTDEKTKIDKYSLTIEFTSGERPNQCRMVLSVDGIIGSDSGSSDSEHWYQGEYYYSIKKSSSTTTVTWQDSSIQRPRIQ